MQYVKLIVSEVTYKKLCGLFDFLLSIDKTLAAWFQTSSFLVAGFYCNLWAWILSKDHGKSLHKSWTYSRLRSFTWSSVVFCSVFCCWVNLHFINFIVFLSSLSMDWFRYLKEVWLNFGNFLPWCLARPKTSNIDNIAVWEHLSFKLNVKSL